MAGERQQQRRRHRRHGDRVILQRPQVAFEVTGRQRHGDDPGARTQRVTEHGRAVEVRDRHGEPNRVSRAQQYRWHGRKQLEERRRGRVGVDGGFGCPAGPARVEQEGDVVRAAVGKRDRARAQQLGERDRSGGIVEPEHSFRLVLAVAGERLPDSRGAATVDDYEARSSAGELPRELARSQCRVGLREDHPGGEAAVEDDRVAGAVGGDDRQDVARSRAACPQPRSQTAGTVSELAAGQRVPAGGIDQDNLGGSRFEHPEQLTVNQCRRHPDVGKRAAPERSFRHGHDHLLLLAVNLRS